MKVLVLITFKFRSPYRLSQKNSITPETPQFSQLSAVGFESQIFSSPKKWCVAGRTGEAMFFFAENVHRVYCDCDSLVWF